MYTNHHTVKVSDLRKHTTEVIEEVEEMEEPVTVFSHSKPKIVIMSFKVFQRMKPGRDKEETADDGEKHGLDFFIDPPEEMLVKKKGIDIVKEIRKLRGYTD
ncbi:MAG: type II toxin-antitoxin system prevent-host-death family antitoxin [Patescibacteria group bacterium]